MADLGPQKIYQSYDGLLQIPDGTNNALQNVQDGNGAILPLQVSLTNLKTQSLAIPTWDDTTKPISPIYGQSGYNSSSNAIEVYTGNTWLVTGGSGGSISKADFSGDFSTTVFTLPSIPTGTNFVNVFVCGVYQNKSTYSITSNVLTFSEAPPFGTNNIEIMIG